MSNLQVTMGSSEIPSDSAAVWVDAGTMTLASAALTGTGRSAGADQAVGIRVDTRGALNLDGATIADFASAGIVSEGDLTLTDVVVSADDVDDEELGYGVLIQGGSDATLSSLTIDRTRGVGLYVGESTSVVGFVSDGGTGLTITETATSRSGVLGVGVAVEGGSFLDAPVDVARSSGPGIVVRDRATLVTQGCSVQSSVVAGVWVEDAALTLEDCEIRDSVPDPFTGRGATGLVVLGTPNGTSLEMANTTLSGHPFGPVYLQGNAPYAISGSTLEAAPVFPFPGLDVDIHGHALMAIDGVQALQVTDTQFTGYEGPAVFLHASSAMLGTGNTFTEAAPTLEVVQQGCDAAPSSVIGDLAGLDVALCGDNADVRLFLRPEFAWAATPVPARPSSD